MSLVRSHITALTVNSVNIRRDANLIHTWKTYCHLLFWLLLQAQNVYQVMYCHSARISAYLRIFIFIRLMVYRVPRKSKRLHGFSTNPTKLRQRNKYLSTLRMTHMVEVYILLKQQLLNIFIYYYSIYMTSNLTSSWNKQVTTMAK